MTHFMYPNVIENISDKLFNQTMANVLMIKIFENIKEINLEDISSYLRRDDIENTIIIMNASTDVTNRLLPYYK